MAFSTCLMCSSMVVPTRELSSSSSTFLTPSSSIALSCAHPVPKPASGLMATKCSLSAEEHAPAAMGRRVLAGVVATGAALAVFTSMAVAAQGPGQEGPRRVAEKADKLLKAADKLNIEEAPPRFGPGRSGGAEDPTKISQSAGSGLTDSSKKGVSDVGKGISDATKDVKKNTGGGFFGFGKKQTESAADTAKGVASDVQTKVLRDGLGRFRNTGGDIEKAAKDAIGQAQSKTNVGSSGGNVLSSLQEGLQGLREGVTQ